jgi:hypothetical protein
LKKVQKKWKPLKVCKYHSTRRHIPEDCNLHWQQIFSAKWISSHYH